MKTKKTEKRREEKRERYGLEGVWGEGRKGLESVGGAKGVSEAAERSLWRPEEDENVEDDTEGNTDPVGDNNDANELLLLLLLWEG